MKKLFLAALVALCYVSSLNAQVVINEFMQSNIDCVMDDLNDFPDSWVELYNAGSEAVDMSVYSIGDSMKSEKAFTLPRYTLQPHAYVLVYCDKEGSRWHTPFRLESGKDCACYLFKNGEIVDQIPEGLKKQPAPNIAYGRKTDGAEKWGYQAQPTPKAANCGEVYGVKDILGDPVFSVEGKVITGSENISLELSLPTGAPEGSEIYYTDDCSEPTMTSKKYTRPISISNTKVIRAKLFCKGYLSPRSVTQSYLYFPRKMTLPIVSIVTNNNYFYDNKIGIYVDGNYSSSKKNYEYNWRRPINFEYFTESGKSSELNQLGETRVTGGASRGAALKSLGIYAHKRFGEKRLSYEFFPDQRPGITEFKSIMLRNAGNDFDYLYMRDAVIQRIMAENVDVDWQAYRPAIVYINGVYKGMLNIRERSNEDNIYSNYGGLEDIDMIENWNELKEGSKDSWTAFQAFYNEHGHTWEEYDKLMDVQEFMNVMIMNLFFCNLDFPGNNIVFWRPQSDGGRWRVIVKDTDFGLGLYDRPVNYNTIEWLHNPNYDSGNAWANQDEHTRLFRRLMEDETFNREFIDRCAIYMGDFMNLRRTWEFWSPMYEEIKDEYPNHRKLFNPWWPTYSQELSKAKIWLNNRVDNFYNMIYSYYKTGMPKPLTINKELGSNELEQILVEFNGVKLSRGTFDGKFFIGRTITLKGENVSSWEIKEIQSNAPVITKEVEGNTLTITMPNVLGVAITAKLGNASAIDQISDQESSVITDIYDASGAQQRSLQNGYNIIRTKDGKTKKIWQ